MGKVIDCKALSNGIREQLKSDIKEWGSQPVLLVIKVGDDPASDVYVRNKSRACKEVGIQAYTLTLPEDIPGDDLMRIIQKSNDSEVIDAILLQLPLPSPLAKHEMEFVNAISCEKDVDCLCSHNTGKFYNNNSIVQPCTPKGIMTILSSYFGEHQLAGKNCVVVGRSNIVGRPMAEMLTQADATVTLCHSFTKNLKDITKSADVLISAVGKPNFITADMVKPGAVVIDVGINRDENGKLVGDVDINDVINVAEAVTPVPGGVGVMTVTSLLQNTFELAKEHMETIMDEFEAMEW